MFYVAKVLSALLQPLLWAGILFLAALWHLPARPRRAQRLLAGGMIWGAFVGWQPVPDFLLSQLENAYAAPAGGLQSYFGVIVLGGGVLVPNGRKQVGLNDAAERMTTAVALARQYSDMAVLFSGGNSAVFPRSGSAADSARQFFRSMGVRDQRLLLENKARTTYENAVFSAVTPGVDKTKRWLLITSAWHMPRAMATFQAHGWNVTAYPVDYVTDTTISWTEYSLIGGALHWQIALHEYFGLMLYRVRNW